MGQPVLEPVPALPNQKKIPSSKASLAPFYKVKPRKKQRGPGMLPPHLLAIFNKARLRNLHRTKLRQNAYSTATGTKTTSGVSSINMRRFPRALSARTTHEPTLSVMPDSQTHEPSSYTQTSLQTQERRRCDTQVENIGSKSHSTHSKQPTKPATSPHKKSTATSCTANSTTVKDQRETSPS